jgi:hypothetical protein
MDDQETVEETTDEPVALAEATRRDQELFAGENGEVPGHADVANARATGEGLASDLRDGNVKVEPEKPAEWSDRGQEYHAGPEQPVFDDSGT